MSSGQVQPPVSIPAPKQYLLMADELTMTILGKIMPGLLFVQVEGMAIKDNKDYMLLVNPLPKPTENEAPIIPVCPGADHPAIPA